MKKNYALLLLVALLAIIPSCSSTEERESAGLNMINPYVDHVSKKAAEKHVGFSINLPKAPFKVEDTMYRENILDPMLEIIMYGDGNELRIRKAPGKSDISGNWERYPEVRTMTIGRNLVTVKGDGKLNYQATWSGRDYSYSVFIKDGLEDKAFMDMIKVVR